MKKIIPFILSTFLLLGFTSLGLMTLKGDSESILLPGKSGPKAIWLAQNLMTQGTPSIQGEVPVSLTHDSLYVGLLRAMFMLNTDPSSLVILLGSLFALSTVFFISRYAYLLGLTGLESTAVLAAMITLPAFVPAILSGRSDPLFALLLTLGVVAYFKKQHQTGYGFSVSVLLPFAVASALHVEALLMVVVLGLANSVCGWVNKHKSANVSAVMFDLFNGILLACIFLLPAVAYHLNSIHVFWPRSPDAWLAIGGGATGQGGPSLGGLYAQHVQPSLDTFGWTRFWPGVVYLLGCAASIVLIVHRQSVTAIHFVVMLLTIPLLAAAAATGLGAEGADAWLTGIQPIVFLMGSFVICRAIHSLAPIKSLTLPVLGRIEVATLGLTGLLLVGFLVGGVQVGQASKRMADDVATLSQVLREGDNPSGAVASDRAAWLTVYGAGEAVDVTGKIDLRTLGLIGAGYHLDPDGWKRLARERDISSFLITGEDVHAALIDSGLVAEGRGAPPWFYSSLLP